MLQCSKCLEDIVVEVLVEMEAEMAVMVAALTAEMAEAEEDKYMDKNG